LRSEITRRSALGVSCGLAAAALFPSVASSSTPPGVVEIHMKSDLRGGLVGFDPIGVLLDPGGTVRGVCDANVHTTTAYSPTNANHSLRIPESARPWSSDLLLPGQSFQVTLTVEGVYDYFCMPHEEGGMVGRLIVGRPSGPGTLPFDYFKAQGRHWKPVPPAAQKTFPTIDDVMRRRVVPWSVDFSK
jgi:plastocyanin